MWTCTPPRCPAAARPAAGWGASPHFHMCNTLSIFFHCVCRNMFMHPSLRWPAHCGLFQSSPDSRDAITCPCVCYFQRLVSFRPCRNMFTPCFWAARQLPLWRIMSMFVCYLGGSPCRYPSCRSMSMRFASAAARQFSLVSQHVNACVLRRLASSLSVV